MIAGAELRQERWLPCCVTGGGCGCSGFADGDAPVLTPPTPSIAARAEMLDRSRPAGSAADAEPMPGAAAGAAFCAALPGC